MKYSTSVAQGQVLEIKLTLPSSDKKKISLEFLGKRTPCYIQTDSTHLNGKVTPQEKENRKVIELECLAGVPADAPPGKQIAKILCTPPPWGDELTAAEVEILPTTYPTLPLTLSPETKSLLTKKGREKEIKKIHKAIAKASLTEEKFWDEIPQIPLEGKLESLYGEKRILDGVLRPGFHRGVDLGAKEDTPILSAYAGYVILAQEFSQEGKMVMVNHGQGVLSAYLHCSKILVSQNQKVEKGQILAKVGSTGVSNSPHLHFGIYIHGTPIDPLFWMRKSN